MENIVVERTFAIPMWDDSVQQRVVAYWSKRRFKFTQISDNALSARRGSWLGNMISSDLTAMKSELSIKAISTSISCIMEVNPRFQIISEWDRTWWTLEMKIFESFLLQGDEQAELWKQFKKEHKAVLLKWSFSGGKDARLLEMSDEDRKRYQ